MNSGKKFWRLLGDYESLSTDEGVALREINLAALARLQVQKATVCEAVLDLAAKAGINLSAQRLRHLIAKQKDNLAIAQEQLARVSCEQQNLSAAGQRLSHVGRAYKHEPDTNSAFQAKG
jgi:hypothetical protein